MFRGAQVGAALRAFGGLRASKSPTPVWPSKRAYAHNHIVGRLAFNLLKSSTLDHEDHHTVAVDRLLPRNRKVKTSPATKPPM